MMMISVVVFTPHSLPPPAVSGKGCTSVKWHPRAKELASRVAPEEKERKAYLDWLWLRAQNMLNESSAHTAVETLAQALRAKPEVRGMREIPARQAKAIIREALGGGRTNQ